MHENPYQSPVPAPVAKSATPRGIPLLREVKLFEIVLLCELAVLLLAAVMHRRQLPNLQTYTSEDVRRYAESRLIAIEVAGLLGAGLVFALAFFRGLYLGGRERLEGLVVNLLICALVFATVFGAIQIDAPTLLYAT